MHAVKLLRLLPFVALAAAPVCCAQQAAYSDALVAVVGDQVITQSDVVLESRREEPALARKYSGAELIRAVGELRARVAQRLVESELLYAEWTEKGYKVPKEVLQKRVDSIVVRDAGGNRERFDKRLMDDGLSYTEFEEKVTKVLAVELLWDEMVRRQVRVSPQVVRSYYDANPGSFVQPGRVKLDLIFLSKDGRYASSLDETARKIQEQLDQKTDFAWLARQYSEGTGAANGGDLGWLNENEVQKDWFEAAGKLVQGQVSPAVKTASGVAFLRVAGREKAAAQSFDAEVAKAIENNLAAAEIEKRNKAYIESLTAKFHVRIFNEVK